MPDERHAQRMHIRMQINKQTHILVSTVSPDGKYLLPQRQFVFVALRLHKHKDTKTHILMTDHDKVKRNERGLSILEAAHRCNVGTTTHETIPSQDRSWQSSSRCI